MIINGFPITVVKEEIHPGPDLKEQQILNSMQKGRKLTSLQQLFCEEYIIDLNATQAAIRAGYSKRSAYSLAATNMKNPLVLSTINKMKRDRSGRTQITQDRILLEIARIAFNDPRKVFDLNGNILPIQQWPDEVAAAILNIKISEQIIDGKLVSTMKEIKFWDKGRQIELAAKHLGMLTDKQDFTEQEGKGIIINVHPGVKEDE